MLRNKNIYFTGKILNVRELANDNAKSFRFTAEERKNLDLKGLPIRLEHEDCLEVGTIKANWNDNHGQHWIMGAIDQNSIPATFAKHSLIKKTGDQKPYYTGLSLQHVHREFPDGRTEKKGIEVSLCTDPRRPNCNVTWCSANERKNSTYKLVNELATRANKENNMEAPQVVPQETEQAPAENVDQSQTQAAPTGAELSEQVYSQFAELMEKEKAQQEKIAQLEKELAKHNETLEQERKKKQEEDAAKGRALMSTFLEHVKELVGEQEDMQNTIEPLIAQNPDGMHKIMEVVSKASKKYQENSIALQKAQNELKDKQLELKFQQLIANKSLGQTSSVPAQAITEVASSKKRQAEPAKPAAKPVQQAAKAINPYAFKNVPVRRAQQTRRRGGMNDMLLKMYNQNKGNGLRAMSKIHEGLSNRRPNY